MKLRYALLAAATLALLPLAGCDKAKQLAQSSGNTLEAMQDALSDEDVKAQKFDHYTDGFNELIDDHWGVSKNYNSYRERVPAEQDPSGDVDFPEAAFQLEEAIRSLKEGRTLSTKDKDCVAADAAVDELLPPAEKLLAQWRELAVYFETKVYRDDKLAKAKAAHESLVANYEATLAGIHKLEQALTIYQRAREQTRLGRLKKDGDMPLYHTVHTMQLAEALVSAAQEKNLREGDKLLLELEASLAEMVKAQAAMEKESGNTNPLNMGLIAADVGPMIGDYRDFKQSKDPKDINDMIEKYNDAVDNYSDIEFKN